MEGKLNIRKKKGEREQFSEIFRRTNWYKWISDFAFWLHLFEINLKSSMATQVPNIHRMICISNAFLFSSKKYHVTILVFFLFTRCLFGQLCAINNIVLEFQQFYIICSSELCSFCDEQKWSQSRKDLRVANCFQCIIIKRSSFEEISFDEELIDLNCLRNFHSTKNSKCSELTMVSR